MPRHDTPRALRQESHSSESFSPDETPTRPQAHSGVRLVGHAVREEVVTRGPRDSRFDAREDEPQASASEAPLPLGAKPSARPSRPAPASLGALATAGFVAWYDTLPDRVAASIVEASARLAEHVAEAALDVRLRLSATVRPFQGEPAFAPEAVALLAARSSGTALVLALRAEVDELTACGAALAWNGDDLGVRGSLAALPLRAWDGRWAGRRLRVLALA